MVATIEHMFDSVDYSASGLPIGELVDAIAEESGQIAAAQCRMLAKLGEFDAREDAGFAWDCKSAARIITTASATFWSKHWSAAAPRRSPFAGSRHTVPAHC